jgi:hypothetical protein
MEISKSNVLNRARTAESKEAKQFHQTGEVKRQQKSIVTVNSAQSVTVSTAYILAMFNSSGYAWYWCM